MSSASSHGAKDALRQDRPLRHSDPAARRKMHDFGDLHLGRALEMVALLLGMAISG